MKYTLFLVLTALILYPRLFAQDAINCGIILNSKPATYDLNGDGEINQLDKTDYIIPDNAVFRNNGVMLQFSSFWQSPAGAFTNCWDGITGYFDGDTLLDVAGFTFNPAKFYIYEQSPTVPNTFDMVQEFIKTEGGSFGPIIAGDTDGDGKIELISPDVLGIARVYIYENDGNNNYVAQPTFSHPSNSEGGQGVYITDLNKNGKKEIVILRGTTGGGEVRIWEHSGTIGVNTYTNIYTYTTPSYIFGKGGLGDSDNDGWEEIFLTYGGIPTFNTFIRRIEFDSASSSFQHLMFEAPSVGMPANYKVYDLGNDNIKELLMTCNSNSRAACYVFRTSGSNSYNKIDSVFETADNNNMLSCDIKVLSGNSHPSLLMGSFNGRVYTYEYNGTNFVKDYENLSYPGAAVRRVYWLPTTTYDGYFNTWSGTNSNGTFYIYKKDLPLGVQNNSFPIGFSLSQNYPNPFNPVTSIFYELSEYSDVSIGIYGVDGKFIKELFNDHKTPGRYKVEFNAADLASGIYFYKLTVNGNSDTKKMMLIK
ncbi:MAG: T9SS type A sorting domain-containing protein [Ignavibacteria bacterium]|nr:T9SS type A sorting domain-containing protein [Ignavibacteria bacterium]